MTTDKCFSCERKDVSPLCGICGVGLNGEREHYKRKPITNADRIRSLSDDEMAEFLDDATNCVCFPCTRDINSLEHFFNCKHESGSCEKEWLEWLKEEAKGGEI